MGISLEDLKKQTSNISERRQEIVRTNMSNHSSLVKRESQKLSTLKENVGLQTKDINTQIKNYSSQMISKVSKLMAEESLEFVLIVDCSSSCKGKEYDTIKGFEKLIQKQMNKLTKVTVVLFNRHEEVIYERADIKDVKTFSYCADGNTALYDALCSRIEKTKTVQKNNDNFPKHVLYAIMTDGCDNCSRNYDLDETRKMIKERQDEGWEFIFLAENIMTKEEGLNLGIKENNIQQYDVEGIEANFDAISNAMDDMRKAGHVSIEWKKPIEDRKNSNSIEAKNPVYMLERK